MKLPASFQLFAAVIFLSPCIASVPAHAQSFYGYGCTEDCSGHQAGYDWAEQNSISTPDECGGNSQSFIEGCQAYADENGSSAGQYSNPYPSFDGEDESGEEGGYGGDNGY